MKKLKIILWLSLPLMLASCLQVGYDTVILPVGEYTEVLETTIDEEAIPVYMQQELEAYMPIYEGSNPPIVEGVYLISPHETVYTSDYTYAVGYVIEDYKVMFSEQDNKTQSLFYDGTHVYTNTNDSSDDVSIIGSGNLFTTYFISNGNYNGISYKMATVISGTKLTTGIKDIYYAFVLLDKQNDTENELMDVDGYRIFKDGDGLAANSIWDKSIIINSQNTSTPLMRNRISKK